MKRKKAIEAAMVDLAVITRACSKMADSERKSGDTIHWNARKLEDLTEEVAKIIAGLKGSLKDGDCVEVSDPTAVRPR